MTDTQYRAVFRLTALCLGVMCILQATLNITLRLHFNSETETETELLNTSYNNLTIDELRTSYADLVKEKHQLQNSYTKLVKENDQLQTSYTDLVKERHQLMRNREELQEMFPKLVDVIRLGWSQFHSSFYYISTEKKTWGQSRQECRKSGTDLVIINSQEEEDFIIEQLGNKTQAWIGLKSKDTDREWKWVDGAALQTGHWNLEQPNDGNNQPPAGNVSIRQNWIPMPCAQDELWVCEITVFE
ncbi:hypothetical protein PHYPO_G00167280 [Pangasianodon hypophthalmus]|uniref:C-type lectin domain-containing protein n=1 Tax=Pangasianodon hypophthalmus TaxID=310915 RepID=A0A5N5JKS0_PANHP|nr:hypothetical protein PHYPO_G00167280 [Pangasianodon hypophthalmus]